jgi:hypothetical protein
MVLPCWPGQWPILLSPSTLVAPSRSEDGERGYERRKTSPKNKMSYSGQRESIREGENSHKPERHLKKRKMKENERNT